VRHMIR
jgi:hypothetical protein